MRLLAIACGMCVVACSGKWSRREELQRRSSRASRLRSPQRNDLIAPEAPSPNEDASTASKTLPTTDPTQLPSTVVEPHSIDVPDAEASYQPRFATRNQRRSFPTLSIPPHLVRVKMPTSPEPEISEVEPQSTSGSDLSSFSPDPLASSDPLVKQRSQTLHSPGSIVAHHLSTIENQQHAHSSSFSFLPPPNILPQACTLLNISSLFYNH